MWTLKLKFRPTIGRNWLIWIEMSISYKMSKLGAYSLFVFENGIRFHSAVVRVPSSTFPALNWPIALKFPCSSNLGREMEFYFSNWQN